MFYEASYDYHEDPNHGPESREAYGAMRMEFSNSDQWAFEFSRLFEKLNARLVPATGVTVPVGAYEFTHSRDLGTLSPARPVSGTRQLTSGGCYGYPLRAITWRGRVEFGPRFLMEPEWREKWRYNRVRGSDVPARRRQGLDATGGQ